MRTKKYEKDEKGRRRIKGRKDRKIRKNEAMKGIV